MAKSAQGGVDFFEEQDGRIIRMPLDQLANSRSRGLSSQYTCMSIDREYIHIRRIRISE
jgi:hypothetical protein